jgi:hypothetical protein
MLACSRRSRVLTGDIAPFDYAQGRLRQGGRNQIFFTNIWLAEPNVREKDKKSTMLPQANRLSSDDTSRLNAHRVTRVNNRSYAVPPPEVDIASGRAEDSIFFHKKFARDANFL